MSKKSKQKTKFNAQSAPYMYGAADTLRSTFDATNPGVQAIASQVQSYLPALGDRAFGENPLIRSAQGHTQSVLDGDYLGANPYLNGMADLARSNTLDGINTAFGRTGMGFSSRHAQSLGRGMGEAELGLRYRDYDGERARMAQAAGMAPSLVQAEYAPIGAYLSAAHGAAELPYTGVRNLVSGMSGLLGSQQTTTQTQPMGAAIIGALGNMASAAISRPRATGGG